MEFKGDLATVMFSRSMRIVGLLLALAQLGVWGFYAPAHRLLHHSELKACRPSGTACHSGCCGHQHSKPVSCDGKSGHQGSQSPHQCPEDEHCGLYAVALQSGTVADAAQLMGNATHAEPFVERVLPAPTKSQPHLFDSRGPPSV